MVKDDPKWSKGHEWSTCNPYVYPNGSSITRSPSLVILFPPPKHCTICSLKTAKLSVWKKSFH